MRGTVVRGATALLGFVLATAGFMVAAPAAFAATARYVATAANGGSDAHACTSGSPCLTIAHVVSVAGAGDTIHIGAGTFPTNIDLTSSPNLTFAGAGMNATFLDGGNTAPVLRQGKHDLVTTITDLTIQHGNGTGLNQTPAGIDNRLGTVIVVRAGIVSNNGTGIFNEAASTVITQSVVTGNNIGLWNFEGVTNVTASTFSGNSVGIREDDGASQLARLTITGNSGDGLGVSNTARTSITQSTIANNGGFGIDHTSFIMGPPGSFGATVDSTIVSGNAGGNCFIDPPPSSGTFRDAGYNLEDDAGRSCTFSSANHDLVGVDPQLQPLTSNGGLTQTMLPAWRSAVIDEIPNPTTLNGHQVCPATDQRGVARPQGLLCDIGAVEALTPLPPGAPGFVNATAQTRAAHLVITPPANGGSPITSYTGLCTSSNGGAIGLTSSPTNPFTVTGLTPAKSYTCKVSATNAVGTGAYSPPSNTIVVPTVPGAPTGVGAAPRNAAAVVSWTAPASNGGSAITGYVVTPFIGTSAQTASVFNSTNTTQTIPNLTNGTAYTFTVAAKNPTGTGPRSAPSAAITVGAPSAPTAVTAVKIASGQLRVTFTAGANNGSAINQFSATCSSSNGGVTKTATGASSPVTVTALTAGKTYTCKVSASNARGAGPASTPSAPVAA